MSPADPARELPGYDGYGRWAARIDWLRRPVAGIPVLLYHSIAADPSPENAWRFNVTPETFARQMRWLADEGYHTLNTEEWRAWAETGEPMSSRSVLITFDDGFRNNLTNALPVLQEHGFRAVFFISSGFSDSEVFPWVRGARDPAAFAPLAMEEIRKLAAAGMEIGAHTCRHQRLVDLSDEDARREIVSSKHDLEQWLERPVTAFAYPYGSARDIRDRHGLLCREAGFATAFTTRPMVSRSGTSPLAVPRLTVLERDGTELFGLKVRGGFEGYDRIRRALRFLQRVWPG